MLNSSVVAVQSHEKLDKLHCFWRHGYNSKWAFPTGVLVKWHNCLLIYWRTSCL